MKTPSAYFPFAAFLAIAPLAFSEQGSISGAVADPSGAAIARADVKLSLHGRAPGREIQSSENGEFSFEDVDAEVAERHRLLGLVPNFFASYDRDAVPLNAKQKLELSARAWFDPSSFVIEGIIAGVWQAQSIHKGFGQGAQGYAKRYGAGFADYGTSLLIERAVTTTISKQDPRYFYSLPCPRSI